jgi:hypothetical protein
VLRFFPVHLNGWIGASSPTQPPLVPSPAAYGDKHEAKLIRDELRSLCPRNAEVINVEPARVEQKVLADLKLTGKMPTSMADFVKPHAAEFTRL